MKTNILNYINKLQGYKTAIKNLHWSSKHMSEHKLLDDIADSVANNQDEIAEMCQGLYGKFKINELKPKRYKITNSKKMLFDLLRDTKSFYSSIKGRELTGVKSVVESFIGELNKFVYLMDMCIKEDIKQQYNTQINEMKNIQITENELRETIQKAIKKTLKESDNGMENNTIQNFEQTVYNTMRENEQRIMSYLKGMRQMTIQSVNCIKQFIQNLRNLTEVGEIIFDAYDDDNEMEIIINLPSITELNEEEYYEWETKIEEIYQQIDDKYLNMRFRMSDEPNENGMYYIFVKTYAALPFKLETLFKNQYNDNVNWDLKY